MSAGNGTATFANAACTYDTMGRIATVGNSADTLTYGYVPGTNMIGSATWQEASINTVNTYDQYKRLTNIAVNNTSVYGYTLNDKNQRTGATLPDGRTWSYSYDTLGQLTGAVKRDSANTQLADLSYLYDQIGNRTSATENNTTTTYTSNLVNQYTQIASQVPTYDADGNMTSYNGWTYTWNGENRLVAAENSDTRLEFSYDYMGRRLEKKVYSKGLLTLYDWSLEKHRKFVYDGYKLIAEFEVEDDNATLFASYLWQPTGLDVPLMRIADNTQTYYIADGNKNIIALKDSSGADVSTYAYTPFGALENPVDGDENPFRFSSEYADDETGLVYYNYRYYSPQLGRWTKRDPSEEEGGINLYLAVQNNMVNISDHLGLFTAYGNYVDLYHVLNYNRNQELKNLQAWKKEKARELEAQFRGLCPQHCCYNRRKQTICRKECLEVAKKLSEKIVQDVGALIENTIQKYYIWPRPGLEGNLFAKFSDMGIECETWSNTVEAAAINAHQTEDGKVVFYISTMLYQQWTTMRHSWTEFYGPCGHKTSDDPSGILQPPTIRGDFSVDFWRSAGKVIDYEMNRHTTTSFSTIGSGW